MARHDEQEPPLLDAEVWDLPRWLTPDECFAATGPEGGRRRPRDDEYQEEMER